MSGEPDIDRMPPAYRVPPPVPPGWEGRQPKHYGPSEKADIPGALGAKVVGLTFVPKYPGNLHALASLAGSESEPPIVLRRNPANAYDANAVEVHAVRPSGELSMIGHLPAALAARIAPEMDADEPWVVARYQVLEMPGHEDKPGLSLDLRRG
jgi:hypothetical protein